MNILIRDIELTAVKKIDELAKEKGYSSRNQFLKNYIENLTVLDVLQDHENRFDESLTNVANALKFLVNEVSQMKNIITHLSGFDMEKYQEFYEVFGGTVDNDKN